VNRELAAGLKAELREVLEPLLKEIERRRPLLADHAGAGRALEFMR
jgi:hypothetical protein